MSQCELIILEKKLKNAFNKIKMCNKILITAVGFRNLYKLWKPQHENILKNCKK